MAMTLDEWDREIAPKLSLMRMDIASAAFHIGKAKGRLMTMPARPNFDTKVEEEIERVRKSLNAAAELLFQFEQDFRTMPRDE